MLAAVLAIVKSETQRDHGQPGTFFRKGQQPEERAAPAASPAAAAQVSQRGLLSLDGQAAARAERLVVRPDRLHKPAHPLRSNFRRSTRRWAAAFRPAVISPTGQPAMIVNQFQRARPALILRAASVVSVPATSASRCRPDRPVARSPSPRRAAFSDEAQISRFSVSTISSRAKIQLVVQIGLQPCQHRVRPPASAVPPRCAARQEGSARHRKISFRGSDTGTSKDRQGRSPGQSAWPVGRRSGSS